jgi:hypothetical protein
MANVEEWSDENLEAVTLLLGAIGSSFLELTVTPNGMWLV